jgi:hypothetical protein
MHECIGNLNAFWVAVFGGVQSSRSRLKRIVEIAAPIIDTAVGDI